VQSTQGAKADPSPSANRNPRSPAKPAKLGATELLLDRLQIPDSAITALSWENHQRAIWLASDILGEVRTARTGATRVPRRLGFEGAALRLGMCDKPGRSAASPRRRDHAGLPRGRERLARVGLGPRTLTQNAGRGVYRGRVCPSADWMLRGARRSRHSQEQSTSCPEVDPT